MKFHAFLIREVIRIKNILHIPVVDCLIFKLLSIGSDETHCFKCLFNFLEFANLKLQLKQLYLVCLCK